MILTEYVRKHNVKAAAYPVAAFFHSPEDGNLHVDMVSFRINRMDEKRNVLSKALGRVDVIALGFGTMVGWSWIMMAASWVTGAGFSGAIIAFILGGGILLLIGLIYGELTAALPLAGGEFVFAYRAVGRKTAFITGWVMVLAYLGVAAWEGIALATALNYLFPIPRIWPLWEIAGYQVYLSWSLVGMAGALAVTILNLIGARSAVLFQIMATAAVMGIAMVMFFGGTAYGDTDNIGQLFTTRHGFEYVLFMIPAMLIGFDVIPQSAEEMNLNKRDIGRMIVVCIIMSIIWYCLLIIGIGLAAPEEIRTSGMIPVADIAGYAFRSEVFADIVIIGAIFGILTTWNGFFMGATRLLFAMGRARIIPPLFSRTAGRTRVPVAAILVVGSICIFVPLLGRNALLWLVNLSSLCALFAYMMVAVTFVILRKKEPDLERPFRIWQSMIPGALVLLITFAYMVLYLITDASAQEMKPVYAMIIAWLMAGVFLYGLADGERRKLTGDEEAYMVFGGQLRVDE